jgi:hypothetical protein
MSSNVFLPYLARDSIDHYELKPLGSSHGEYFSLFVASLVKDLAVRKRGLSNSLSGHAPQAS